VSECFAGRERVMSRRLMRRAKPDTIIVDRHACSRQHLSELRRQQSLRRGDCRPPKQPALFLLRADCYPQPERPTTGRYRVPTLFAVLERNR
jgi:hypothetical protein